MDSLVYNENIDTEDLNERANIVESYKEAIDIIKEYKDKTKANKKNIILFAYQQSRAFRKLEENRNLEFLLNNLK